MPASQCPFWLDSGPKKTDNTSPGRNGTSHFLPLIFEIWVRKKQTPVGFEPTKTLLAGKVA